MTEQEKKWQEELTYSVAVQILRENVRSDRGVIGSGLRDNDQTRMALDFILNNPPLAVIPTLDDFQRVPVFAYTDLLSSLNAAGVQFTVEN